MSRVVTPRMGAGDVLAAYGLLRPSADGLDRLGLRGRVSALGPCRIPGCLIDLVSHPALLAGDGEVMGDLLRMGDADVGDVLDDFEEFVRDDPAASIYVRVRVALIEPRQEAWVYLWNRAPDAGPLVASGDWLRRS